MPFKGAQNQVWSIFVSAVEGGLGNKMLGRFAQDMLENELSFVQEFIFFLRPALQRITLFLNLGIEV
jgi:hypothetical protein